MDCLIIFTLLCITILSTLLSTSTASQMELQPSLDYQDKVQLSVPSSLPRKLRFTREVIIKGHDGEEFASNKDGKEKSAGKEYQRKRGLNMPENGGTWPERVDRGDMSQYFTMDYSLVRRRPPIHNKSIPVRP